MYKLLKRATAAVLALALLGINACAAAESIPALTLPASLKIIGTAAFAGDTSIGRVVVPAGTTEINSKAFADSSLTELVLPDTVTYIAEDAFAGCGTFTVDVPEGCYAYERLVELGVLSGNYTGTTADGFAYSVGGNEVFITGFDEDLGGEEIVIPRQIDGYPVTYIAPAAFALCSSLKIVTIPEGVTTIGDSAFAECSNLTDVFIPKSVTVIDNYAFRWCEKLERIYGMEGVTAIDEYAFWGCSSLTSCSLPEGLIYFGDCVFASCTSLTSITIPDSIEYAGGSIFSGCSNLRDVTLSSGFPYIYSYFFSGCTSLTYVRIPEGITSLLRGTFEDCSNLFTVYIPESVTDIGDDVFAGCPYVTIYGEAGSYAETYAGGHGISFSTAEPPAYDSRTDLVGCYRLVSRYVYNGNVYREAVLTKECKGVEANCYFFMDASGRPVTNADLICKLWTMRMYREMEKDIDSSIDLMHSTAKIWASSAKNFMKQEAIWTSGGTAIAEAINAYRTGGVSFLLMLKDMVLNNALDGNEFSTWMQIMVVNELLDYMDKMAVYNDTHSAADNKGVYDYDAVNMKLALYVNYRYAYEVAEGMCMPVVDMINKYFKNNGQVLMYLIGEMLTETATGVFPALDASVAIVQGCANGNANAWDLVDILLSNLKKMDVNMEDFQQFAKQMTFVTETLTTMTKVENGFIQEEDEWLEPYYKTPAEIVDTQMYKNHLLLAQ